MRRNCTSIYSYDLGYFQGGRGCDLNFTVTFTSFRLPLEAFFSELGVAAVEVGRGAFMDFLGLRFAITKGWNCCAMTSVFCGFVFR